MILVMNNSKKLAWLVSTALVAGLHAAPALAQITATLPPVPSVKIAKGALVSPSTADAWFATQAQTATDGLCRDYSSNAQICPGGIRLRAPEIRELARALRGDPNLIYEYVRNGIDTEFMFGSHKGPLGVIIDRAGTPLDQAHLLVELLRESAFSARYKYGTRVLSAAEFTAWTGISDAKAACDFLAAGGIPASLPACSGAVTSVTISHVWVEADIAGAPRFFDPSYKPYDHKAGIDVRAAMGLTSGQVAAAAGGSETATGTAGVSVLGQLNAGALSTTLQGYDQALLTRLRQADLQAADLDDVIGGRTILPAQRPAGGWLQNQPAGYSVAATWAGGVPDAYRAKFRLYGEVPAIGQIPARLYVDASFFADETYGRRLEIVPVETTTTPGNPTWTPSLQFDGVGLPIGPALAGQASYALPLQITVDHPFAAGSGTYGDAVVTKPLLTLRPATLLLTWGKTSPGLLEKWDREQAFDTPAILLSHTPISETGNVPSGSGDLMRAKVAATWAAQFSKASEIHAQLANARVVSLHNVGVVSSEEALAVVPPPIVEPGGETGGETVGFTAYDEVAVVDIESSFGLVSKVDDDAKRRAAIFAIAATGSALEGGVVAQMSNSPDATSTASRLAWGNNPEAGETPVVGARAAYRFAAGASTTGARALTVYDGGTTAVAAYNRVPAIPLFWVDRMRDRLATSIQSYAAAGFDVVASSEASLGPGHRIGSEYPKHNVSANGHIITTYERLPPVQRGGAIVATKYDPAAPADPLEIAHILTRWGRPTKGGGAPSVTQVQAYGPVLPAQIIKDRFVDRSAAVGVNLDKGAAGFTSPALASVGVGEFPMRLERRVELRGGTLTNIPAYVSEGIGNGAPSDGPMSNWKINAALSSSGFEGMGQGRVQAATTTIAAFAAMQDAWGSLSVGARRDVTGALVADWWADRQMFNVVTINQGAQSKQFAKLADGGFLPINGGAERLTMSGAPVVVRPDHIRGRSPGAQQQEAIVRGWDYRTISFELAGVGGDVQTFPYWGNGDVDTFNRRELAHTRGWRLGGWTWPNGISLTLNYQADSLNNTSDHPILVTSNLGPTLSLPARPNMFYEVEAEFDGAAPCGHVVKAVDMMGGVTRLDLTAPRLRTVAQRPDPYCRIAALYTPADTVTPSLSYVYDSVSRVKEARDGVSIRQPGVRGAHQFFIAEGYRGERQDPEGGRYAVETLEGGRLTRTIDELGRVTTSGLDGRKRVVSRTYPEGDQDLFGYDVRDNMVSLVKKAKPGSGLADLTSTVSYGEGPLVWTCVNPKTCNRPTASDGPRTDVVDVTSYSWNGATGSLTQVLKPADYDGARPQTDYGYTVLGGVSLMTSMTEKIDSSSSTTTTYEYDAGAQYRLKASTTDSGGLNLRTCYQYDAVGNITGVSDPRTATCPATIQ
ncbi:RHS repeat domain-containing protein [Caulobacter mirabilis]|uniref:Uncharacterized protein n=1 Tax=Caulobacter mirabilis TaxID=69666 RepID=A0A2D2AY60_9CAUL|nr:RHS repeat domain-containing protein [Caulobacter mirabilis]ATQ42925.1 hypothetical protein CSW64_11155 [Caulobacter mirabilis]